MAGMFLTRCILATTLIIFYAARTWAYAPIQLEREQGYRQTEIDFIIRTATAGGQEEQFLLGSFYDEGGALDIDYEAAAFWYAQAAAQNYAPAQFHLGRFYYFGLMGSENFEPDYIKSCALFEQAANQNLGEAMEYMGYCALEQSPVPDWPSARYWFEKAAKQGNIQAQFLLGQFYDEGQGGDKNPQKAEQFYLAAAMSGHGEAAFKLGYMFENALEPDYDRAGLWYKQAAMLGHSSAFFPLGRLYYQGLGVAQNYAEAYRWFEKAARLKDGRAAFNLGVMLAQGQAGIHDERQARFWYGQAAMQGEVAAYYNLALLYEEGRGGGRDLVQALHFYQMAARAGDIDALVKIGSFYEQGLGVSINKGRALDYYQRAAEMGDEAMQYYLGMLYSQPSDMDLAAPDYIKARFWLEKAANQGHVLAENQLNRLDRFQLTSKKIDE